jgi:hypothetical protein
MRLLRKVKDAPEGERTPNEVIRPTVGRGDRYIIEMMNINNENNDHCALMQTLTGVKDA